MRHILLSLAAGFAMAAALAPHPAWAEDRRDDLSGRWTIEIVDGPSIGDHGVIDLTPMAAGEDGSPRYRGAMRFTDSRANVTADEDCVVTDLGEQVTVRCQTDEPGWVPDDFDLTKTAPGEMRGPHISAVSGEALFKRIGEPKLLS